MFTQDHTAPGHHGPNALQHVTVAPNIDHVFMIVVNQMMFKQSSVVVLDDIPTGLLGPHVPSAMNSPMNLLWPHDPESMIVVPKVKSKKRLVLHHDVHTGQHGADGQVVQLHVVQESQQDHVSVMVMTNFA